jgi:hypothetical protein
MGTFAMESIGVDPQTTRLFKGELVFFSDAYLASIRKVLKDFDASSAAKKGTQKKVRKTKRKP